MRSPAAVLPSSKMVVVSSHHARDDMRYARHHAQATKRLFSAPAKGARSRLFKTRRWYQQTHAHAKDARNIWGKSVTACGNVADVDLRAAAPPMTFVRGSTVRSARGKAVVSGVRACGAHNATA